MIWLIGSRGMLGSEVEKILKNRDLSYFATDRECDITDPRALEKASEGKDIDWIINCSAYTAVDAAEDDGKSAFMLNSTGVGNIASAAVKKDAAFIHISTDYVFSGDKEEPYTEEDPADPKSVYGASKEAGEKLVTETLEKYFIIRTAWLYGAGGNNFVRTMLKLFQERDRVGVVSDQFGSPTYAPDLAAVIVKIIQDKKDKYGIYHFSGTGRISWFDFALEIYRAGKETGILSGTCRIEPVSTEEYPVRAKRPVNSVLSKEKIKRELGINVPEWKDSLKNFMTEVSKQ